MRRLYQKIYLVLLASLIAVVAISGLSWRIGQPNLPHSEVLDLAGELVLAALPPADAPPQAQQRAVERLGRQLRIDVALFDQSRAPVAAAGGTAARPGLLPDRHGNRHRGVLLSGGPRPDQAHRTAAGRRRNARRR